MIAALKNLDFPNQCFQISIYLIYNLHCNFLTCTLIFTYQYFSKRSLS